MNMNADINPKAASPPEWYAFFRSRSAGAGKPFDNPFFGGILRIIIVITALSVVVGCMRYMTHRRPEALVEHINIDKTLLVAERELEKGGWGSVLTLWAIRDQHLTPNQADRVSELYFRYIDGLKRDFNSWHLTWAVANMYRLGPSEVKTKLKKAYEDAKERARRMGGLADKHVNGEKIYMGDAHIGGRFHAKRHIIAPGNEDYLQSVAEYEDKN